MLGAGRNCGCGASREHAAWVLQQNGFRVVVSTEIADIFRSNALKNGVLPVVVPAAVHERLVAARVGTVAVDVANQTLRLEDGTEATFTIDPFAMYCLVNGVDELSFLLQQVDSVASFEQRALESQREEFG